MPASDRCDPIDQFLRDVGPIWQQDIRAAGDRVKAAYLPMLLAAPRDDVVVCRDLPYGTHARQVLDVYHHPEDSPHAPVVVFVHGGAFVRGVKDINAAMYGNVLTWFARQGCIGVNVEYRLAPEARYPQGALDVASACAWVSDNIQQFGGDPRHVCLIGHSAGGTHAATFACDPLLAHLRCDICCLVLISARLQAETLAANPNAAGVRAYFGDDAASYEHSSPMTHAARLRLPVYVVNAQYENPLLDVYALEFASRIAAARGVAPRHTTVADHNHVSIMAHFNTGEQRLGEDLLDFFASARKRR